MSGLESFASVEGMDDVLGVVGVILSMVSNEISAALSADVSAASLAEICPCSLSSLKSLIICIAFSVFFSAMSEQLALVFLNLVFPDLVIMMISAG